MRIKKENTKRHGLFLLLALCMVVFLGAAATDVTYSYYTDSGSGSDSATVAKFDVGFSIASGGTTKTADEGTNISFPFTVTNRSEVTVSYDVKVELPKALPTNTQTGKSMVCYVTNSSGTRVNATSTSSDKRTLTFSNVGTLASGASSGGNVVFGVDAKGQSGISDLKSLTYNGVKVTVYATQVD